MCVLYGQCLGLTSNSMLSDYSWQCSRDTYIVPEIKMGLVVCQQGNNFLPCLSSLLCILSNQSKVPLLTILGPKPSLKPSVELWSSSERHFILWHPALKYLLFWYWDAQVKSAWPVGVGPSLGMESYLLLELLDQVVPWALGWYPDCLSVAAFCLASLNQVAHGWLRNEFSGVCLHRKHPISGTFPQGKGK